MKPAVYIETLQKKGKLFFTTEDFIEKTGSSKSTALVNIHYLRKKGTIVSPYRGFYVIVPLEQRDRGSIPARELVVLLMNQLEIPYYAGLLTAAAYHGATHQPTRIFQVISNKRFSKNRVLGDIIIQFTYKKRVEEVRIDKISTKRGYLMISSAEETLKDIFHYPRKSGGLSHQATILSELITALDIKKLEKLIERTKETAWVQRVGYMLSQINPLDEKKKEQIIQALQGWLQQQVFSYIPLAPMIDIKGRSKCAAWKIIKNTTIESDI